MRLLKCKSVKKETWSTFDATLKARSDGRENWIHTKGWQKIKVREHERYKESSPEPAPRKPRIVRGIPPSSPKWRKSKTLKELVRYRQC